MWQKQTVIASAPSSEIISRTSRKGCWTIDSNKMSEGSGHMQSIDSIDWQPSSLPAVKIEQPGGSDQLLIRVITPKRSTDLTSKLFEVLVEEILDILHSHKSSSKEKILHSIRVKVRHITADSFLLRLVILIRSSHSKSIKHSLGLLSTLLGNCSLEIFVILFMHVNLLLLLLLFFAVKVSFSGY